MKLELLVRTSDNPNTPSKNKWDVIAAGVEGGVWGTEEEKVHQVLTVNITDKKFPAGLRTQMSAIYQSLIDRVIGGEFNPKVARPFEEGDRLQGNWLQSKHYFDLDQLPGPDLEKILDNNVRFPKIAHEKIKNVLKTRSA